MPDERATYRVAEVAAATGLSPSAIRNAMTEGTIPTVTVGRHKLIPADWLQRLKSNVPTQGGTPTAVGS